MVDVELISELLLYIGQLLIFTFVVIPYSILEKIYELYINPSPPKSVKGEIVLITGTGHGLGKKLAIKYAQEGATVICWDINEQLNDDTVQTIKNMGYKKVYGSKVDVSNRDEVLAAAKKVQKDIGDVTILLNNAGIMPTHPLLEHTPEEIRRIMDINVMAHFWTLQAFLPSMKRNNHGHIVALSSMAGLAGLNNLVPYCSSKFAVKGMMEAIEAEFRQTVPNNQIKFTTICPYMVDTGLCKRPDIKFKKANAMLNPDYVVDRIFDGQVRNKTQVTLPTDMAVMLALKSILPERVRYTFMDWFKVDLLSDLN